MDDDDYSSLVSYNFDYDAYFQSVGYQNYRNQVLAETARELRGLGMGPAGRKMWSATDDRYDGRCPTHQMALVYEADTDMWVCSMSECSTIAIRRAQNKALPPKARPPKTLMEVFGQPSMPSKPHSMKPSHLGLRIEDGDDGKSTCILFDVLLNIEIDVTDYVEGIIDEHRRTVSLVLSMSNVVRQ
jgi:hypothetical protein